MPTTPEMVMMSPLTSVLVHVTTAGFAFDTPVITDCSAAQSAPVANGVTPFDVITTFRVAGTVVLFVCNAYAEGIPENHVLLVIWVVVFAHCV
jgi:hypothetical protein